MDRLYILSRGELASYGKLKVVPSPQQQMLCKWEATVPIINFTGATLQFQLKPTPPLQVLLLPANLEVCQHPTVWWRWTRGRNPKRNKGVLIAGLKGNQFSGPWLLLAAWISHSGLNNRGKQESPPSSIHLDLGKNVTKSGRQLGKNTHIAV